MKIAHQLKRAAHQLNARLYPELARFENEHDREVALLAVHRAHSKTWRYPATIIAFVWGGIAVGVVVATGGTVWRRTDERATHGESCRDAKPWLFERCDVFIDTMHGLTSRGRFYDVGANLVLRQTVPPEACGNASDRAG